MNIYVQESLELVKVTRLVRIEGPGNRFTK